MIYRKEENLQLSLPTPTPECNSYVKYKYKQYNQPFANATIGMKLNLVDGLYCMDDFYKSEYCHHATYSGVTKWASGDFSDDYVVLSYVDCDGVEHPVYSIESSDIQKLVVVLPDMLQNGRLVLVKEPTPSPSKTKTQTPTYTCKVTDVASWDGTSGGGTRSGPSDINKAFDRNDSTYTGWAKVIYSQSWKLDRFKFNNVQTHTLCTLRFYMYGGVNVGIYAEKADMYIRYRELGGSWVYLRNVKNSYMPNPQIFKYEVQVDSVDRVDVYWKDIGQGSISYRYHYVEFVHDCPVPSPTKTATPSKSPSLSPSASISQQKSFDNFQMQDAQTI